MAKFHYISEEQKWLVLIMYLCGTHPKDIEVITGISIQISSSAGSTLLNDLLMGLLSTLSVCTVIRVYFVLLIREISPAFILHVALQRVFAINMVNIIYIAMT